MHTEAHSISLDRSEVWACDGHHQAASPRQFGRWPGRCFERLGDAVTRGVRRNTFDAPHPRFLSLDSRWVRRLHRSGVKHAVGIGVPRSTDPPPLPPSLLRGLAVPRTRLSFPRAAAMYDCVARHSKTRFHPRAKKSRSNFPRFDFSKRGFCASRAQETPPETHPRFRRSARHKTRHFTGHRRAHTARYRFPPPPKTGSKTETAPTRNAIAISAQQTTVG
jgi:hypothetical protein